MQIQISWLLQKPTDLDLHCLQRHDISGQDKGSAGQGLKWVKYCDQQDINSYEMFYESFLILCVSMLENKYCINPKYWDTWTPYHTGPKFSTCSFYHYSMNVNTAGLCGKQCRPRPDAALLAQASIRHFVASYLGLHCLLRHPVFTLSIRTLSQGPYLSKYL